jgi:hypothetical protein
MSLLIAVAACSSDEPSSSGATSVPAPGPVASAPATPAPATPAPALTTTPATTPSPAATDAPATTVVDDSIRVGWIGGSEVVLREVSLPAVANQSGATIAGRPLAFEPFTQIAPTPGDTANWVNAAADAGVDGLIVTFNPQWLYGRECPDIEPPHDRYACLLEDGEIVGSDEIAELVEAISSTGLPTLIVLMPTSVDALESPQLAESIALANDRLQEMIPAESQLRVVDETLTAGRPEFREGAGFHDMVHTTPDGAAALANLIVNEMVGFIQG